MKTFRASIAAVVCLGLATACSRELTMHGDPIPPSVKSDSAQATNNSTKPQTAAKPKTAPGAKQPARAVAAGKTAATPSPTPAAIPAEEATASADDTSGVVLPEIVKNLLKDKALRAQVKLYEAANHVDCMLRAGQIRYEKGPLKTGAFTLNVNCLNQITALDENDEIVRLAITGTIDFEKSSYTIDADQKQPEGKFTLTPQKP